MLYNTKMNKSIARIAYYSCLVVAILITYQAMTYAGELAYTSRQPSGWLSVLAFFSAITLVVVAIMIKAKIKF